MEILALRDKMQVILLNQRGRIMENANFKKTEGQERQAKTSDLT